MTKIITAKYPSNIALVKYWGKHGNQLPMNPSLSLTLSKAFTETKLTLSEKQSNGIEFDYYFEGAQNENFKQRILKYINNQPEFTDLFNSYALRMDSENSFPHSAGIASSASAFASIAAVLLKASAESGTSEFNQQASDLARRGSGSACRSFYGKYAMWGKHAEVAGSSDLFAIPIEDIHTNFQDMRDAILIVEDQPKKVSSSVGHGLMNNHPYAAARFEDARQNCLSMLSTLKSGDFESFISITEREALSLHSMMMTSGDYYMLMKPGTVEIIDKIFSFREETKLPLCFTLDAGPNIHLLYPEYIKDKVHTFVKNELKDAVKSVIYDKAGEGGEVY